MSDTFTKLASSIITSSIWSEDDKTRIIWITMLAMCDETGFVETSIPGLSAVARVSLADTVKALQKLESPDEFSRSSEFEGRRVCKAEGGFVIINHGKYRDKMRGENRKEYVRNYMRKYMSNVRQEKSNNCLTGVKPSVSVSVSDSESNKEGMQGEVKQPSDFDRFWDSYPKKKGKLSAKKAWCQTSKIRPEISKILLAVSEQAATDQWKKDGGQFIPFPATWLRAGRWDDVSDNGNKTLVKPSMLTQDEFSELAILRKRLPERQSTEQTEEYRAVTEKMKARMTELEAKAAQ